MRFLFVLANLLLAADVQGSSCLVMARVCLSVVATLRGRICSKPTAAGLIFLVGCSSVSIASVWCPCCLCMVLHVASVWCCLCMVSSCCLLPLLPLLPVAFVASVLVSSCCLLPVACCLCMVLPLYGVLVTFSVLPFYKKQKN